MRHKIQRYASAYNAKLTMPSKYFILCFRYFSLCVQLQLCVSLHSAGELDIQVLHIQRILFDEPAPALDILAHQRREDLLATRDILELHLQ